LPFLTNDLIRDLPKPATRYVIIWDAADPTLPGSGAVAVTGLGLRHMATGYRSFILDYRTKDGSATPRRPALGRWPQLSVDRARKKARDWLAQVEAGDDPQADRERKRKSINELADEFEAEHVPTLKAGTTQENYRGLIRIYIRPRLGTIKIANIDEAMVKRLHRQITVDGKRHQANRVVGVLSSMMEFAIENGDLKSNPCTTVKYNREDPRVRDLTSDERGRLTAELSKHDSASANAIKLLLTTGARRGEVLELQWGEITFGEQPNWNRRGLKTKSGKSHTVPLNSVAAQLLMRIRDETIAKGGQVGATDYVFASAGNRTKHVVDIKMVWKRILRNAGIADLHLHDLRHHFASELASSGSSLPLIGALLGHRSTSSTQRYARLFQDAQREATERAGNVIAGIEPAKILPGPGRR
jgi:integrase